MLRNSKIAGTMAAVQLGIASSLGCGLEWKQPASYFDGVDEQGYVSYWETVDEFDLGGGLKFPLLINFNSGRNSVSPYLGKSFILPLLEANFTQFDESTFVMMQPDGWKNIFRRDGKDQTLLNGSAGWKATIFRDRIIAWAPCGWKIEFVRGKIVSLTTPKNRRLEYTFARPGQAEIRENGSARLTVNFDGNNTGVIYADGAKRWGIELAEKPEVVRVAGQNSIAGVAASLKRLSGNFKSSSTFRFSVDNDALPTITVSNARTPERVIVWDPQTRRIVKDGEFTYEVRPGADQFANAAIGRRNGRDVTEFWHHNAAKGQEVIQRLNGTKEITSWFTAGALRGKLRRVEKVLDENGARSMLSERYFYSQTGEMTRLVDLDGAVIDFRLDGRDIPHFVLISRADGSVQKITEEQIVPLTRASKNNETTYEANKK